MDDRVEEYVQTRVFKMNLESLPMKARKKFTAQWRIVEELKRF